MCLCAQPLSRVSLFATLWTIAHHGILQARILEWAATSSSRGSSPPRDRTRVCRRSCSGRHILPTESPESPKLYIYITDRYIDTYMGFTGGSVGKESACSRGDLGMIPGLGRSSGRGNDNPLQCSCLENPMDRGAWQATVHGVAKNQTRLSTAQHIIYIYIYVYIYIYMYTHTYIHIYTHTRITESLCCTAEINPL